MSRRIKSRRVCKLPEVKEFIPVTASEDVLPVVLTVDEYEAVRLIDKEGFSQEVCSMHMQVARTTVQRIYNNARKKIDKIVTKIAASATCVLSNSILHLDADRIS